MLMIRSMRVRVLVDPELRRRDAALEDPLGRHVPAVDRQAAERALQLVERQARRRAARRGSCRRPRRRSSRSRGSLTVASSLLEAEIPPVAEDDVIDTSMPISSPAATSRRVSSRSSALGVGIARRMVVKHHHAPRRCNAPRGTPRADATMLASRVPTEITVVRITRCFCRAAPRRTAPRQAGIARQQVFAAHPAGVRIRGRSTDSSRQRPPAQLHRREQARRPRRADARHPAQIVEAQPRQPGQPARGLEHVLRDRQRAPRSACRRRAPAPPVRCRRAPRRRRAPASRAAGRRAAIRRIDPDPSW